MSSPSPSEQQGGHARVIIGHAMHSAEEGETVEMFLDQTWTPPVVEMTFEILNLDPDFLAFMCCNEQHHHINYGEDCIPFWIERGTE